MGDSEGDGSVNSIDEQDTSGLQETGFRGFERGQEKASGMSHDMLCMKTMFELMMVENRRRDDMINRLMDRLTPSPSVSQPLMESTTFHVMPDQSRVIGKFDGDKDVSSAKTWIENLETSASLNRWSDSYTLETARAHLTGPATHWFKTKRQLISDWASFKKEFKKTYEKTDRLADRWSRMKARKQGKSETVLAYYYEKVELCGKLKLTFSDAKEEILAGLYCREVAMSLIMKEHEDYDALMHDIITVERVKAGGASEKSVKPEERKSTEKPANGSDRDREEQNRKARYQTRDSSERSRLQCYGCRKEGHFRSQCPERKVAETRPNTVQAIEDYTSSNKFLRNVLLDDSIVLKGFIDTGSSVCTIREGVVRKFNLKVEEDRQPLYGFGDVSTASVHTCGKVRAKIAIDNVCAEDIELLVVPQAAQSTDLLIGRSYSELPHIAYARKGDRFVFGYAEEHPFKNLDVSFMVKKTYQAVRDTEIGGRASKEVEVQCGDRNTVLRVYNASEATLHHGAGKTLCAVQEDSAGNRYELCKTEITPVMINVDNSASDEERRELHGLLNDYRDCFALSMDELGCTDVTEMDIQDTGVPVRCAPYKTSAEDRETIANLVAELKQCGLVSETNSPYASPVLLVRKKNGDPRMVVDYRKLNSQTTRMNFPVPGIDEQFEHLAGCHIFATLDLANGYMQVPLTPEARRKTAFITADTTGEFNRMVFGLTNAPYEFVRLMNLVLGPLRNKICCCYLDDVIIPAKNWGELLDRIRLVLDAFRKAKLTLNLKKCEFGKTKVAYLGFTVSEDGLSPGPEKLLAIENFPQPRNVHEVRRFLGLTGFFRRFVRDYATIARPISDLTKKDAEFIFTETCVKTFNTLKECLVKAPVLKLYDATADTELHTDASAVGIAGILMQRDENSKLKLVYCVSKKTTEAESKYHSSRLELLAIVWCVERLRGFLIGVPFKIVTDCQAIVFLNGKKSVNPQVARWFSVLQEYDYTIEHRKGERMAHVDALSRAPVEDGMDTYNYVFDKRLTVLMTFAENQHISMIQQSDTKLRRFMDILRKTVRERTRAERDLVSGYELQAGKLFVNRRVDGEERKLYVVPDSMRKAVLVKYHDLLGHFSVDRTIARILERYWFRSLRRYARRHIAGCLTCLVNKVPAGKKPGELHPIPPTSRPFERIHADNLGPFVKSSRGYLHILVIIDSFSRFVCLYALKSTKAAAVIPCMEDLILKYGVPKTLVTDRGTCFTAKGFEDYCSTKGINHVLNSPRHPQGNGMVERVNRTILPVIQAEMENERRWDQCLRKVEFDLNTAVNKTTRKTPFRLLHGYNPSLDNARVDAVVEQGQWNAPEQLQEAVGETIRAGQEKYKRQYDRKRYTGVHYDVGEVVLIRAAPESNGESTKLRPKYKGPYVVVGVLPADTYRIETLEYGEGGRRHSTTAHVSQMKGYYNPHESEDDAAQDDEAIDPTGNVEPGKTSDDVENADQLVDEERPSICRNLNNPQAVGSQDTENTDEGQHQRPQRILRKPVWWKDYKC